MGTNRLHNAYMDIQTNATTVAFFRCHCLKKHRLREMQDAWMICKAEKILRHVDRNAIKNFFKAIYGPCIKGIAALFGADETTRLTEKSQILKRLTAHFKRVLNRLSAIAYAAINQRPQMDTNNNLVYKHGGPCSWRNTQHSSRIKAADLNHLAVDVETVAKRLVFGRKKRPDITASDLPNSAVEHSKILTPSTETSPVNCLEIGEEPVAAPSLLHLPQHVVDTEDFGPLQDFNVWDPVLPSQLQYYVEAAEMEVIQLPGLVPVDGLGLRSVKECCEDDSFVHLYFVVQVNTEAIPHGGLKPDEGLTGFGNPPGISSQCSGNANCELRCVTPDFSEQGSEPAKQADPATSESPQKGDSFSGAGARVVDKKSVCRKSCYLPHASTNSNALVEENLERVETSQSKLFPQSSTSPNSKSPDLVVEIEAKERLPERHDAKSGNFEMACRTCRFQLRTISLQLCRRQVEFEVRRTEWDKRERILQEEISQLRSQAEQLARENAEVKRRLVDREAEINQIAQALHLLLEKLSLQQPFGAPAHPNQDQSLAAEEFLGLLRSLATKHLLRPFTAVAPDTQQTDLPSQNAAAMSARCGGMRADNGLSFVKANSTSSRNEDDLETDGELDKDSLSDICIAARGSRRAPTATLARVETPVGSLYSSVSSLRTVDEVQFRTGLSSLDAQIAKLRLSLVSQ
ncbi:unnamed protein product [Schistocephalus solidus]|uniref:Uncharacterized protein n=1 Tax=Schistocephalus solidus TaxID=70667 RepID=A0A183SQ32_SCHSO|nr:unnamed protein product [Schistocephalus solidus]